MRRAIKTEAFVLRKIQLLNKDAIIILFSKELGKIAVVAKGIRTITSRRLASLMTGNLINIGLAQSRDTFYLQQVKTISLFAKIKRSSTSLRQSYLFLFLADSLLAELQREDLVYMKIKKIMIALSNASLTTQEEADACREIFRLLGYTLKADSLHTMIGEIEEIIGKKIPPIVYN